GWRLEVDLRIGSHYQRQWHVVQRHAGATQNGGQQIGATAAGGCHVFSEYRTQPPRRQVGKIVGQVHYTVRIHNRPFRRQDRVHGDDAKPAGSQRVSRRAGRVNGQCPAVDTQSLVAVHLRQRSL